MVTELCTHFILQWYETHTMLCNGMKCIPVLILKSQRHTFSQTNNFSQINKFFVTSVFSCDADQIQDRLKETKSINDKKKYRIYEIFACVSVYPRSTTVAVSSSFTSWGGFISLFISFRWSLRMP